MAGSAKEFGRLLTEAIQRIKSIEDKPISVIQDELGYAIDRTGATVENWRKGNLPVKQAQTKKLSRALAGRCDLDRVWFKRFLSAAGYTGVDQFVEELRPLSTGSASTSAPIDPAMSGWPLTPPEQPPVAHLITGRQRELIYFEGKLKTAHLAVITGMPGVGKTSLAITLIRQMGWAEDKTFWYTFRGAEGIDDIVWRLTNFLAWYSNDTFLRILQGSNPPPAAVLFDALLHTIHGKGYLLCFDDFHLADELAEQLFNKSLQTRLNRGGIDAVIISRTMPNMLRLARYEPLSGLSHMETQNLLLQHGISLSDELTASLYALTQGNPQLLVLAIDTLKHGGNLAKLIARILETINIENYILTEVDDNITTEEREVMKATSVLMNYPGTRAAIEAIAAKGNVWKTLNGLYSRHLLLVHNELPERQYSQHATVQTFYYNLLDRSELQAMHQRAGEYYEVSEKESLKAALHFERAEVYIRAAQLVVGEKSAQLIHQGHAHAVVQLLERLVDTYGTALETAGLWLSICETRGMIYRAQGIFQKTIEMFQIVLTRTQTVEEKARILYELGTSYEAWGKFEEAHAHHLQSLELYRNLSDLTGLAKAHSGIGWACYELGQFIVAREHFEISLQLAKQAKVEQQIGRAEIGLGLVAWREGKLTEAQARFEQSRQRLHQLGELASEAAAISNLGLIQDELGQREQARILWEEAIEIFDRTGRIDNLLITYCNLGESYFDTGDYKAAANYQEEAVRIAQSTENTVMLSYATARLAEAQLALGDKSGALQLGQRALQIAQTHHHRAELGVSYRVLGDTWLALDDLSQAHACLEQSLPILQETSQRKDLAKAQANYQTLHARLTTE